VVGRFLLTHVGIDLHQLEGNTHLDHRCMAGHVGAALAPVERVHRYPLVASASRRFTKKSKKAAASPCNRTLQGPSSRQSKTVSPLRAPLVSTRMAARRPEKRSGRSIQAMVSGSCR